MPIQRAKPRFTEVKNVSNITANQLDIGQIGGRRNIIINGAMQVAQRGTSTTLAHDGTTDGYSPDRFRFTMGGTHEQLDGTVAQVADHPTSANGKSLKWTTGTAESSYDADEYVYIVQKIEAQNLQHLQYGNSNAEAITISFYVKSSITGTYAFGLYKEDSTTRIFNKTYTIDSANTWEKKTLTFVGDTDSGAGIVNDNGTGLYVSWHLSAGTNAKGGGSVGAWKNYGGLTDWADGQATNAVMTTASATWQMTECQLEVGEQATPFEHRSFGEELNLCRRYFFKTFPQGTAPALHQTDAVYHHLEDYAGGYGVLGLIYPVEMRTFPTGVFYPTGPTSGGSTGQVSFYDGSWKNGNASFISSTGSSTSASSEVSGTTSIKLVQYNLTADAEL